MPIKACPPLNTDPRIVSELTPKPTLDSMGGVLEGAINEVIGGPPEDMNEMPPNLDPRAKTPIYDGSELAIRQDCGS